MSQHLFRCSSQGRDVRVLMGYDRPLDYVFCMVEWCEPPEPTTDDEDSQPYLYSNLDDEDAGTSCRDVQYFTRKLVSFGITLPPQMVARVHRDVRVMMGNAYIEHFTNGTSRTADTSTR